MMKEDKFENMLSQLITMVGNIQTQQNGMKEELGGDERRLRWYVRRVRRNESRTSGNEASSA